MSHRKLFYLHIANLLTYSQVFTLQWCSTAQDVTREEANMSERCQLAMIVGLVVTAAGLVAAGLTLMLLERKGQR